MDTPEYDIFAEAPARRQVTLVQGQWAEVLALDAGVRLAANLLRQHGLGQHIATDADRVRHNEAVHMLEDIIIADPARATDVVLLAILPQTEILPRKNC